MDDMLTPQFQSLQGFHRLVIPQRGVQAEIQALFQRSLNGPGGFRLTKKAEGTSAEEKTHDSVRLLDTFLEFPEAVMVQMLSQSNGDVPFRVQILLLSPYSQLARLQAKAWSGYEDYTDDALVQANRSLHRLLRCVVRASKREQEPPDLKTNDQVALFRELLEQIRKLGPAVALEVRFYDVMTVAPMYIISEYLVQGLLLDGTRSPESPWLIFVDDHSQQDDLFDRLSRNFDEIWRSAVKKPKPYRLVARDRPKAFVAMSMAAGRPDTVYEAIKEACEEAGVAATRADDVESLDRITETIVTSIAYSDLVICDLSGERPNVYYEGGFAHAMGKPVIFLSDRQTDAHFDVRDYPILVYSDVARLKAQLKERLKSLLGAERRD